MDSPISQALIDVAEERLRQVVQEGRTLADDYHQHRELARAAAAYVGAYYVGRADTHLVEAWPPSWRADAFKPTFGRQDLVRAAALLVAELERLDRLQQPTQKGS